MGTTPSRGPRAARVPALNAVGGSEDARSIMSDEFDGLDANEKAAVEAPL